MILEIQLLSNSITEDEILSWPTDLVYAKYEALMLLTKEKVEYETVIFLKTAKKLGIFGK